MTINNVEGGSSGATPFLAFIVGALIIAVAVLGFFMFTNGHIFTGQPQVMPSHMNVTVKAPPAPNH
jgi:hypothetical protein